MEIQRCTLHRCVSVDNSESGRSLMARSNHRIYYKRLHEDWTRQGELFATLTRGTFVAMKQFCGGVCKNEMKKLCKKEYDLLSKCNHENIITVLELFLDVVEHNPESWPAIYMELGECSLQFVLTVRSAKKRDSEEEFAYPTDTEGGYTWRHCISWLSQTASAMAYLHDNKIVHRDLKCSNVVMFSGKTVCKVCDFDLSRLYDPEGMSVDVGTWRWMAPEVRSNTSVNRRERYDYKADCYSFGVLICEAIFRQRPFNCYEDRVISQLEQPITPDLENTPADAMTLTRTNEGKDWVVKLNRSCSVFSLSDRLWALVEKLLCWNPSQRPTFAMIQSKLAIEEPSSTDETDELPILVASGEPTGETEALHQGWISDTGLVVGATCPSIPSVQRAVKLIFKAMIREGTVDLTPDERERILEVLKMHAESVVSFFEEEQEGANNDQAVDDDEDGGNSTLPQVRSHFRFTDAGWLELEISGAELASCTAVAEACQRNGGGKFVDWLASHFRREISMRRLRGVRFELRAD